MIAEKVMRWASTEFLNTYGLGDGVFTKWQPLTDLNQCFEALEAWKDNYIYPVITIGDDANTWLVELYIDQHYIKVGSADNKSLNAAICLALAEATTGEQQTLEV